MKGYFKYIKILLLLLNLTHKKINYIFPILLPTKDKILKLLTIKYLITQILFCEIS